MADSPMLSELAMNSIIKYFNGICNKLLSKSVQLDFESYKEILDNLQKQLSESVPRTLANDETSGLLDELDKWLSKNDSLRGIKNHNEICRVLAQSIIHPLSTRIEPKQLKTVCLDIFPENKYRTDILSKCIAQIAPHLPTNLKALHLANGSMDSEEIELPSELEELSGISNDDTLLKVSTSCRKIKSLDVSNMRKVTNKSVEVILKMEHLEKLNITGTGITKEGINNLLDALIDKGNSLKLRFLKCNYNYEQLALFSRLPSVTLSLGPSSSQSDDQCVSALCKLPHLRALEISIASHRLTNLVKGVGDQLVYLKLSVGLGEGEGIPQLMSLGQYCCRLRCLHLNLCLFENTELENWLQQELPGFKTITCLQLEEFSYENDLTSVRNSYSFFLNQCINVRKLKISYDPCKFSKFDIRHALFAGNLKSLEEINFELDVCSECDLLDPLNFHANDQELMNILTHHCLNLRSITGIME